MFQKNKTAFFLSFIALLSISCNATKTGKGTVEKTVKSTPLPYSETDKSNPNGWVLNTDISDEFDAEKVNEQKWLIQGRDGVYQSNFIGRPPAEFSTENVLIEDGKLKLRTKWEPDFPFTMKSKKNKKGKEEKFENMTTAAIISKKLFHYGYMEIKCKTADISASSAFWMTGKNSELDVFEIISKPKQRKKVHLETEYKFSIHDWHPGKGGPTVWSEKHQLDFRPADDYHVYGCEWDKDYLKFYADGKLISHATREEIGEAWVLVNPTKIWADVEIFPWHGVPEEGDLPADFSIEYIRVWQK